MALDQASFEDEVPPRCPACNQRMFQQINLRCCHKDCENTTCYRCPAKFHNMPVCSEHQDSNDYEATTGALTITGLSYSVCGTLAKLYVNPTEDGPITISNSNATIHQLTLAAPPLDVATWTSKANANIVRLNTSTLFKGIKFHPHLIHRGGLTCL